MDEEPQAEQPEAPERRPRHAVRLPGFTAGADVGLGEVIKKATSRAGIKPCGGCLGRAERMNRWMSIKGRRPS